MGSMNVNSQIIAELGARPVSYNPTWAKIGKGAACGIFMSQLLYWHNKGSKDGWVYKTINEFQEETGLSRYEQETAIKRWSELGVLKVELKGVPATRHFQVDLDALYLLVDKYCVANDKPKPSGEAKKAVHKSVPSLWKSTKLVCGKPTSQSVVNQQTIIGNIDYTESTSPKSDFSNPAANSFLTDEETMRLLALQPSKAPYKGREAMRLAREAMLKKVMV